MYGPACSSWRELKYRDSLPSWCNSVYLAGFELVFPFWLWRMTSQFAKQFAISVKAHQIDGNDQWHRITILRSYTCSSWMTREWRVNDNETHSHDLILFNIAQYDIERIDVWCEYIWYDIFKQFPYSISDDEMPDVISRDVDYEGYEYGFCGLRRWL